MLQYAKMQSQITRLKYCKRLDTVNIGNGNIEIGEAVFSGCADNLTIIVAGKNYTADTIKDGLK